ncbi:MAG: hypothetical protein WC373_14905 [Smithella sp.]|jgi:hypothetical protein
MKIGVCLDHKTALKIYRDTGAEYPVIPYGKNTIWHHFKIEAGNPCVIINQRGFEPRTSDNEEECNGCSVAMVLDDVPDVEARAALEKWVVEFLEIK